VRYSVLVVFAHPDDETIIGPLMARYANEGHAVWLISLTSGQRGVRPHFGMPAGEQLGKLREEELRCAARALGIHPPFLLGYQDQGISSDAAIAEAAARVRQIVDETRADVMITFGPDGMTGHGDHRAAGAIATVSYQQQALLRHQPRKLYYIALPESLFLENPDPLHRRRPFWTVSDAFITTVIDCGEHLDQGFRAFDCHKTQWAPKRVEELKDYYRRILGGRAYLRLALSRTPFPHSRESSVFEGL
jgi:LmbE family N-acetylglucosaminyl deacetylase